MNTEVERKIETRIKIETDRDPSNPREEWDHISVMFCKHRRYDLGDKDAEDPRVQNCTVCGCEESECECEWCWTDDTANWDERNAPDYFISRGVGPSQVVKCEPTGMPGRIAWCMRFMNEWIPIYNSRDERLEWVLKDVFAALPLYLYDHSGITMSTGPFSCPWDSGQVGLIYITNEKAKQGKIESVEQAEAIMKDEVKEYDNYLTGNVWGISIDKGYYDGDDFIETEYVDSCWGFNGTTIEETGLIDYVEEGQRELLKEAWERRFDH